jgi:hypothetical protein
MSIPVELPSIAEIERIEKQRSDAIAALEISADSKTVKCQRCFELVPIVGKLDTKINAERIRTLTARVNWIEKHGRSPNISRRNFYDTQLNEAKQELDELLKENAKVDKLRDLPLYSTKLTGFKFVCSACFDRTYRSKRK